ncbi:MAG TPA: serine hydrolase domain-containing protein, partial [Naasia sp.]
MNTAPDGSAVADDLRRRLGPRHPVAAVATVVSGEASTAVIGAPEGSTFELGSISKGITGLLYADAIERGEVTGGTRLGEVLPLDGTPAGKVTLAALSTHTSGLPRLPTGFGTLRRSIALWRHGTNPYGETLDELLAATRSTPVGAPRPRYSNLGFELLGHAVAAAAGRQFGVLLQDRIAGPLGVTSLYAPHTTAELDPAALRGRGRGGRLQEPWTGEAIAPAGGIRATIADTATLAAALLDGSAPGVAALEP